LQFSPAILDSCRRFEGVFVKFCKSTFASSAKILDKTVSVYTLKVKNMIPKFLYSSQLDHSGKNLVAFPVYEANLKTGEIIAYNTMKQSRGSKEASQHSPVRH
tara:strand:+ start:169 stop:477 length:309 start_codon:yes stop_codon:yes gene_type:complete